MFQSLGCLLYQFFYQMFDTQWKPRRIFTAAIALFSTSLLTIPAAAYADYTVRPNDSNDLAQSSSTLLPSIKASAKERELIAIPGTSVSLSPPPSFALSDQFSGFINPETLSSIVVAELPSAAHLELASLFASTPEKITDTFAERGITLTVEAVSSVLVGESQIPLIKGTQTVGGVQIDKYFTLFGGESTILLTVNVVETEPISEQTIVEVISSVTIAPVLSIEQKIAELPFSFEATNPFQVFNVLLGSTVLLSPDGESDPAGEAPIIVIASSLSPARPVDLASFASQLLRNTEGFAEASIVMRSPAEFAGGDGYFIRATLADSTADSTVLQYLRILPNNFYIRMLVVGNSQELERLSPAIQAIQSSVKAKE